MAEESKKAGANNLSDWIESQQADIETRRNSLEGGETLDGAIFLEDYLEGKEAILSELREFLNGKDSLHATSC